MMRPLSFMFIASALASFWLSGASAATTTVITTSGGKVKLGYDTIQPGDLTLVLQDFNDSTPKHTQFSNNVGRPHPTFETQGNGYAVYSVAPTPSDGGLPPWAGSDSHDPRITFASPTYNVNVYDYVRTRQSYNDPEGNALTAAPQSEMWPNNPVGSTQVQFGTMTHSFQEVHKAWKDPQNPSIVTSTQGGFRWDPVVGSLTTLTPVHFNLDYFMVDRGRVVGTEFDSVGTSTMNWSPTRVGNLATLINAQGDSVLAGTTSGTDPYMTRSGLSIDTSIYKFVEIRLKIDVASSLQFFWATNVQGNTALSESKSVKTSTIDTQFHTYLFDFSEESTWSGNLTTFRIDLGNDPNVGFELDYVRFREIGAIIPEPSKAMLILGGISLLGFRRRRS